MSRPQGVFNKKELEKRRLQKKKEKEQRKENRKANTKDGSSLDDMIAYIDEDGNISATPPDPLKKRKVNQEDIVIGSSNTGPSIVNSVRNGKVTFFNQSKGFGFIKDTDTDESIFVHNQGLLSPINEGDMVTFETERGPRGLIAVSVKKA